MFVVALSLRHWGVILHFPSPPAMPQQDVTRASWSQAVVAVGRVPGCFPLLERQDCLTHRVTSSSHLTAAEIRTRLSKDRRLVLPVVEANVTLIKPVAMNQLTLNCGL